MIDAGLWEEVFELGRQRGFSPDETARRLGIEPEEIARRITGESDSQSGEGFEPGLGSDLCPHCGRTWVPSTGRCRNCGRPAAFDN